MSVRMSKWHQKIRWFTPTRLLKSILSVFIVYHLLAILILPMGKGLLIRELGRHFYTYANIFGFNTTWQFFSPGPSPIFYLEYTFTYPEGDDDSFETSEPQLLPEKRTGFGVSDFYSRRLYSMRFLSLDEGRLEKYMAPWLCRKDPRAESVTIRQKFAEIQAVERHRGDMGGDNFSEMSDPADLPPRTYRCVRGDEHGA